MGIEVRPVRSDEQEEAGRVTALAYREFADTDRWERYLETIADVPGRADVALVLVALEDGRILGSATLELGERIEDDDPPLEPDEAHIRMLGVDPSARRRGVGRLLVEACIDEARRADKTILTLNTTERMESAMKMYESMGFRRGPDRVYDDGFRLLSYELPL